MGLQHDHLKLEYGGLWLNIPSIVETADGWDPFEDELQQPEWPVQARHGIYLLSAKGTNYDPRATTHADDTEKQRTQQWKLETAEGVWPSNTQEIIAVSNTRDALAAADSRKKWHSLKETTLFDCR